MGDKSTYFHLQFFPRACHNTDWHASNLISDSSDKDYNEDGIKQISRSVTCNELKSLLEVDEWYWSWKKIAFKDSITDKNELLKWRFFFFCSNNGDEFSH